MTYEVFVALKKVVKHWEDNLEKAKAGTLIITDISYTYCALCILCIGSICRINQYLCPIYEAGYKNCDGTPYYLVYNNLLNDNSQKTLVKNVTAELNFLKSLLPEEKK